MRTSCLWVSSGGDEVEKRFFVVAISGLFGVDGGCSSGIWEENSGVVWWLELRR